MRTQQLTIITAENEADWADVLAIEVADGIQIEADHQTRTLTVYLDTATTTT